MSVSAVIKRVERTPEEAHQLLKPWQTTLGSGVKKLTGVAVRLPAGEPLRIIFEHARTPGVRSGAVKRARSVTNER